MNIQGENIVLRAIEPEDNDMLMTLVNDPNTEKMIGGSSYPVSTFKQKRWYEELNDTAGTLRCIIALNDNVVKAVGTIILTNIDLKNGTAEIHIKMTSDSGRGKGYGTDAVNTIVKYAFNELRLNCIYSEILEYNVVSQKLFEKCNFKLDGILRSRIFKGGNFVNIHYYSILKDDILNVQ